MFPWQMTQVFRSSLTMADIGDKNYTAFVGCTDQESGELLGKWFMEESGLEKGSKVAIIEDLWDSQDRLGVWQDSKKSECLTISM